MVRVYTSDFKNQLAYHGTTLAKERRVTEISAIKSNLTVF